MACLEASPSVVGSRRRADTTPSECLLFCLVGMEHCSNWDCAEHVRNTFPDVILDYLHFWTHGNDRYDDFENTSF